MPGHTGPRPRLLPLGPPNATALHGLPPPATPIMAALRCPPRTSWRPRSHYPQDGRSAPSNPPAPKMAAQERCAPRPTWRPPVTAQLGGRAGRDVTSGLQRRKRGPCSHGHGRGPAGGGGDAAGLERGAGAASRPLGEGERRPQPAAPGLPGAAGRAERRLPRGAGRPRSARGLRGGGGTCAEGAGQGAGPESGHVRRAGD